MSLNQSDTHMANNKPNSAVDDFLNEVNGNEQDPLKVEQDPFADTAVEKKEVESPEENSEDEEKVPFHQNKKLQKFIEKEVAKRLSSQPQPQVIERVIEKTSEGTMTEDEGMKILTRIIGNDTPEKVQAIQDFRNYLSSLEEKAAEKALEEVNQLSAAEREAENKSLNELEEGFDRIESRFNADLSSDSEQAVKLRNDFIDFVRKVSPKNEDGEVVAFPDLESTFEVFQSTRKGPSNNRAKELASRSMSRSVETTDAAKVPQDQSWAAVTKLIDRLKS